MAKIFLLCFTLVALTVIAESKSLGNAADLCQDCPEAVVAGEAYKRSKRAEAPAILNSISGLVTGILDTNWRYIAKINHDKMNARRRPDVIIGPGSNNTNRVMFNSNQGYDYHDYGSRDNNNRNQRNYNRNNNNRGNFDSSEGYDYNDYDSRNNNNRNQRNYNRNNNNRGKFDSSEGYDYNDYGSRNNNNRNQRYYNRNNNYNDYHY